MSNRKIGAIVAVDEKWGIGKNGDMPWPRLSEDLKRFKNLTTNSMIVMGKNTWLSLPKRPLPSRENIVISKTLDDDFAIKIGGEAKTIITKLKQATDKDIWIIGGAEIYRQFLPFCHSVHITRIQGDYGCDTKFPEIILSRNFVRDYIEDTILDNDVETQYEIWEKYDTFN